MLTLFNNLNFKKSIIIFWMLWWVIAFWTDLIGGLAHLGWLQASWALDINYPVLVKALAMYHPPYWLPVVLFFCILFGSLFSALAFIRVVLALNKSSPEWMPHAQVAFIISIIYWLIFFIADELVMKFDLAENHMVQGGFQLLTYLALYILPDNFSPKST